MFTSFDFALDVWVELFSLFPFVRFNLFGLYVELRWFTFRLYGNRDGEELLLSRAKTFLWFLFDDDEPDLDFDKMPDLAVFKEIKFNFLTKSIKNLSDFKLKFSICNC